MKRVHIAASVRRRVLQNPCAVCGSGAFLEVDHIVALSDGGTDNESNLQCLCGTCNSIKITQKTNPEIKAWIATNPEAYAKRLLGAGRRGSFGRRRELP